MDVTTREWQIRIGDIEEGPINEIDFQNRLRAGEIPLKAEAKSNMMDHWKPLLEIISSDASFRRPSSVPAAIHKKNPS